VRLISNKHAPFLVLSSPLPQLSGDSEAPAENEAQ